MNRLPPGMVIFVLLLGLFAQQVFAQGGGPPGGNVNAIAIDPSYSGNVYAGLSGGVFKSTNGGANWTPVHSGLTNNNIRALAVDPAKPTTIYAGTSGGVFKSIDSGANWSVENNGLPGVRLNCTATPAAPTGVSLSPTNVLAVAVDPSSPSTAYAVVSPTTGRAASDASGAVFKSSDGGASWVPANSGLNHTAVLTLAIDPKNPRTLYAGTVPGGIFKSVDGAATWTRINFTAASTDIAAVVVDPVNSGTVYTVARNDITRLACAPIPSPIQGTDSGIYKTMDGGTTWIAVNWGGPPGGKVNAIAIDPSYSGNVYAGLSGGVFKSTNGGANWTPVSSGLTNNNIRALAVDPATPTTIYAGTSGGVFKSIDSGANWSVENNGLPGVRLNCTATPAAPTGVSVFCRTWQAGLTFASRARAKTQ